MTRKGCRDTAENIVDSNGDNTDTKAKLLSGSGVLRVGQITHKILPVSSYDTKYFGKLPKRDNSAVFCLRVIKFVLCGISPGKIFMNKHEQNFGMANQMLAELEMRGVCKDPGCVRNPDVLEKNGPAPDLHLRMSRITAPVS